MVRASDRSFQLKWIETSFDRGSLVGTAHWTGILTIVSKPPASAETLRKNPLGIYIDGVDWAKEIEPAGAGSGAPEQQPRPSSLSLPSGSPLETPNTTTSERTSQ